MLIDKTEDYSSIEKPINQYKPYVYTEQEFLKTRKVFPVLKITVDDNEIRFKNSKLLVDNKLVDIGDNINDLCDNLKNLNIQAYVLDPSFFKIPSFLLCNFSNIDVVTLDGDKSPIPYTKHLKPHTLTLYELESKITNITAYNYNTKNEIDLDTTNKDKIYLKPDRSVKVYITKNISEFLVYISLDSFKTTDGYVISRIINNTESYNEGTK